MLGFTDMVTQAGAAQAAFIVWRERIAPVFDTASTAVVVARDAEGRTTSRLEVLPGPSPALDLRRIKDMGVDTLVCGAMSRPMQQVAASCGLRVVCFVAGRTEDIVTAWLEGRLDSGRYAMPGCRGRRRRRSGKGRGRNTD